MTFVVNRKATAVYTVITTSVASRRVRVGSLEVEMSENNDEGMDKYAVDEDGSGVKTADAQEGRCPICGAKLEPADTTNVLKCPTHGTLPFEDQR